MRSGTRSLSIIVLLGILCVCAGCGGIYTNVRTPMPTLDMQLGAESQEKTGTASAEMFLWFFVVGDCSVARAMKDGGITEIHHVDAEMVNYLFGVYGKFTTIVYGE
ncbi:MAG: TRL-like family protein [Deltaproteobacteria bacterium]|nr:TRL-like family protein [Deltaproteobacteria bacterium]